MQLPDKQSPELGLPIPIGSDGWMAYFFLYVDESGKLGNSDCTSLCGYLTHVAEWERLSQEWNNLRLAWDVPTIHMRRILYPDQDPEWSKVKTAWGKVWDVKRDAMLAEFAGLIERSHAVCVGAVMDAADFASRSQVFRDHWQNPLYISFYHVFMNALDKLGRLSEDTHLSIVMDEDREYAMKCYDVLDSVRIAFPRVQKRVDSICFGDDKAFPALQMADMIAYEARRLMRLQKQNPEAKPSELFISLTRRMVHQPQTYDAKAFDMLEKLQKESGGSNVQP